MSEIETHPVQTVDHRGGRCPRVVTMAAYESLLSFVWATRSIGDWRMQGRIWHWGTDRVFVCTVISEERVGRQI